MNLVEMLDAEIAVMEQRLVKLREARELVADLEPQRAKAPTSPVAVPKPRRRGASDTSTAIADRVWAFLSRQSEPVTRKAVVDAVDEPTHKVAPEIDRLIAAGRVVKRGQRRGTRLGTPKVMASSAGDAEGD